MSIDEALTRVREGWEERRISRVSVHRREKTFSTLEEVGREMGASSVTEGLIAETARRVKARHAHVPSQGAYMTPLKELCLLCGISCDEVPDRAFEKTRATVVPERFEAPYKGYLERLRSNGVAAETERKKEGTAREFLIFVGGRIESLEEMSSEDVESFLEAKSLTCSASHVRKLRSRLKGLLKFLVARHGVPEAAAAFLSERSKTPPVALQPTLKPDEVARILSAAAGTRHHPKRTLAWVSILVQYAVRVQDIVNLKLDDVDWARGLISFSYAKTNSPRSFPLTEAVRYALLDYMMSERPMTASCPYMFPRAKHPVGKLTSGTSFSEKLRAVAKEAGVEVGAGFGCHSLRRSSATALLEGGLPYPDISGYLNHSQSGTALSGTTMRYLRCHPSRLRSAALEVPHE